MSMDDWEQLQEPTPRILPVDCLYFLYEDLRASAASAKDEPWDWLEAAAHLLAQVPALDQRAAWAILLVERIVCPARPFPLLVEHLLMRSVRYGARERA